MTFFLGTKGNVRLRRATSVSIGELRDRVDPSDINTSLNRLSFDGAGENLLTGDRVDISTDDARGLLFFNTAIWSSGTVEQTVSADVNVNAAGGLRFFGSFEDAINNTRANEYALASFAGDPVAIRYQVRDVSASVLGNVIDYTFATDREAIDATALNDKFRQLYSAGILSGSGSITCAFDYTTAGVTETPLLMLQLIQRLDIGSEFDCGLYLTDKTNDASVNDVFYSFTAMITKAGVEVRAGDIINCTIDFVATGEIRLLIGQLEDYILKEDDDRLKLEQSLDFLLKETED
jgi:hypothetical protein